MESHDEVVLSIEKILQRQYFSSSEFNIYKVPMSLCNINLESYTPQVISIGPFHYGKGNLISMEEHKFRYLQRFFHCANLDPKSIIQKVRSWEERARNCYAEPINMNSDEFVKLLLIDGCFIVEFLMRYCLPEIRDAIDSFIYGTLNIDLFRDLIKLENQLPFFVLEGLFEFYDPSTGPVPDISFAKLAHIFFGERYRMETSFDVSGRIVCHFVNLLRLHYIPPPLPLEQTENEANGNKHRLQPPTATELYEAGVIFKRAENKCIGDVITGINFRNGVLEIPHIEIYDSFETYLRNVMAFEQCHQEYYYVTHFALFMDNLINTEKDVDLLIEGGIITNYLGSSEDVCKLFNTICKQIDTGDQFYFNNVSREIHKYYGKRRHRWMASLRHNYFNTPWASISFAAALFLLLLTIAQTILSGFSINK